PEGLFDEAARRRVSLGLIIGEIVRQQGIRVDPQRVRAAVEEMASTYDHPQAVIDYYYADRKRLSGIESLVLEGQVVDWVLGQVTVEDQPFSFAEVTESASVA
ncbi:MAG: trigger factor, partial [Thiocapsa sp.]|nr:trigger factor [Thiocapsa sp.]